jgi:hypothetical protein
LGFTNRNVRIVLIHDYLLGGNISAAGFALIFPSTLVLNALKMLIPTPPGKLNTPGLYSALGGV